MGTTIDISKLDEAPIYLPSVATYFASQAMVKTFEAYNSLINIRILCRVEQWRGYQMLICKSLNLI